MIFPGFFYFSKISLFLQNWIYLSLVFETTFRESTHCTQISSLTFYSSPLSLLFSLSLSSPVSLVPVYFMDSALTNIFYTPIWWEAKKNSNWIKSFWSKTLLYHRYSPLHKWCCKQTGFHFLLVLSLVRLFLSSNILLWPRKSLLNWIWPLKAASGLSLIDALHFRAVLPKDRSADHLWSTKILWLNNGNFIWVQRMSYSALCWIEITQKGAPWNLMVHRNVICH